MLSTSFFRSRALASSALTICQKAGITSARCVSVREFAVKTLAKTSAEQVDKLREEAKLVKEAKLVGEAKLVEDSLSARKILEGRKAKPKMEKQKKVKRPPSGYNLFIKDKFKELWTQKAPGDTKASSVQELFKSISDDYKNLGADKKGEYKKKSQELLEVYRKEKEAKKEAWKKLYALSAYQLYIKDNYRRFLDASKADVGKEEKTGRDMSSSIIKELAESWKNLSGEEKDKYLKRSADDKAKKASAAA